MSVFIDGMNMPRRCFECPCLDTEDGLWCSISDNDLRKEHGINLCRPYWCPLAEVSISMNELNEILKYMVTPNKTVSKYYDEVYHYIKKGLLNDIVPEQNDFCADGERRKSE